MPRARALLVPIACLGVTEFGQSSSVEDAHAIHGIDTDSIVAAAADLAGL